MLVDRGPLGRIGRAADRGRSVEEQLNGVAADAHTNQRMRQGLDGPQTRLGLERRPRVTGAGYRYEQASCSEHRALRRAAHDAADDVGEGGV